VTKVDLRLKTEWLPAAVLPNIQLKVPVEGNGIALVPPGDPRIKSALQISFLLVAALQMPSRDRMKWLA
jgi:hypothetical protein